MSIGSSHIAPMSPVIKPPAHSLRLLADPRPPNLVDSAALKPADPGAWGLLDTENSTLDLFTESIGAESCDAGKLSDVTVSSPRDILLRWERTARKYPPPLPWLNGRNGRRSRFMQAERTGGRMILKEYMIQRPEILQAIRQDGRLRLQLVRSDEIKDDCAETGMEVEEERAQPAAPVRCQVEGGVAQWWDQRFVTTA